MSEDTTEKNSHAAPVFEIDKDKGFEEHTVEDIKGDAHQGKLDDRVSVGVTTDDAYNPLRALDKSTLLRDVDEFVDKFGLQDHREAFYKGALVAQRPKEYLDIPELSDADKHDLSFEQHHVWKNLPPLLIYCGELFWEPGNKTCLPRTYPRI